MQLQISCSMIRMAGIGILHNLRHTYMDKKKTIIFHVLWDYSYYRTQALLSTLVKGLGMFSDARGVELGPPIKAKLTCYRRLDLERQQEHNGTGSWERLDYRHKEGAGPVKNIIMRALLHIIQ
jgi:hypothetical protein